MFGQVPSDVDGEPDLAWEGTSGSWRLLLEPAPRAPRSDPQQELGQYQGVNADPLNPFFVSERDF